MYPARPVTLILPLTSAYCDWFVCAKCSLKGPLQQTLFLRSAGLTVQYTRKSLQYYVKKMFCSEREIKKKIYKKINIWPTGREKNMMLVFLSPRNHLRLSPLQIPVFRPTAFFGGKGRGGWELPPPKISSWYRLISWFLFSSLLDQSFLPP